MTDTETDDAIHPSKTELVRTFPTAAAAWAFVRECDAAGIPAGYPSLDDAHAVQFLVERREWWEDHPAMPVSRGGLP